MLAVFFDSVWQVKFLVLPVETAAAAEDCPRHHPKVDARRAYPLLVSSSYLCRNLPNIFRMELAVSVEAGHPYMLREILNWWLLSAQ
eukprot:s1619_g7.t1